MRARTTTGRISSPDSAEVRDGNGGRCHDTRGGAVDRPAGAACLSSQDATCRNFIRAGLVVAQAPKNCPPISRPASKCGRRRPVGHLGFDPGEMVPIATALRRALDGQGLERKATGRSCGSGESGVH